MQGVLSLAAKARDRTEYLLVQLIAFGHDIVNGIHLGNTGNILFGRPWTGTVLLFVAGASGWAIYRDLGRRGWKVIT